MCDVPQLFIGVDGRPCRAGKHRENSFHTSLANVSQFMLAQLPQFKVNPEFKTINYSNQFLLADTPGNKIVRCISQLLYSFLDLLCQKYSARVESVLPVLLSALRVSPPVDGNAHAGKEIGKEIVVYTYDQVRDMMFSRYVLLKT